MEKCEGLCYNTIIGIVRNKFTGISRGKDDKRMYCTRKVNDDYTWVGADCRRLALFEGVFGVPDGISFNSYLLTDEKTVLFDGVDSVVRRTFR